MCTIVLKNIINTASNLPDAGSILFDRINDAFMSKEKVIIDMEDITSLSSVFLNTSIGKVIDVYGISKLKQDVSFSKITRQQAERLKEYLSKVSI